MKNILIIDGHPDKESFSFQLAESYRKGAEATGATCTVIHLADISFDPILHSGYKKRTELEPDLLNIQQAITKADHLVFVYPVWWATYPALLKGFVDRVFIPAFAFKYRDNSMFWDKLLKGKSARLIITMDAPKWYYALVYKSPGTNAMKKGVLEFCGIKPVRVTTFSPVKSSDENTRKRWINQVVKLGEKQR
jgi:putative NADPH-quinone reductase